MRNYNYWSKEMCHEKALECETIQEFRNKYKTAYNITCANGWRNEVYPHLVRLHKPNKYWNKENCIEVALTCKTKTEFAEKFSGAHNIAYKNGWLMEISKLIGYTRKSYKYWTKEQCHKVALACNNKEEFKKLDKGAYNNSYKFGWVDEICSHMYVVGSLIKRLVYVYEFSDNTFYVGLTCNEKRRNIEHFTQTNSAVYIHYMKTKLIPIKKIISDGYINADIASKLEGKILNEYLLNGWTKLNKAKTGNLGFHRNKLQTIK